MAQAKPGPRDIDLSTFKLLEIIQDINLHLLKAIYKNSDAKAEKTETREALIKKYNSLTKELDSLSRQNSFLIPLLNPYMDELREGLKIKSKNDEEYFLRITDTISRRLFQIILQSRGRESDLRNKIDETVTRDHPDIQSPKVMNISPSPDEKAEPVIIKVSFGKELSGYFDQKQNPILNEKIIKVWEYIYDYIGVPIAPVYFDPDSGLLPFEYSISINNFEQGRFEIYPNRLLALNIFSKKVDFESFETRDPSFGVPAYWILPALKEKLEKDFRIIDASTVFANHVQKAINENILEFITFEMVSNTIDNWKNIRPKEGMELLQKFSVKSIQLVFKYLLEENVSIRNVDRIFMTLVNNSTETKNTRILSEKVRIALSEQIISDIDPPKGVLPAVVLSKEFESEFLDYYTKKKKISDKKKIIQRIDMALLNAVEGGPSTVLLVPGKIRRFVKKFLKGYIDHLHVLSEQEIPNHTQVKYLARAE